MTTYLEEDIIIETLPQRPTGPVNRVIREGEQPSSRVEFYNNPAFVSKAPIVASLLLEYANVRTEHTAAGQSLTSWLAVFVALLVWQNFYRVCTPTMLWARRMNFLGICMNLSVIATVVHFRYFV
jgi:hypothetical protein